LSKPRIAFLSETLTNTKRPDSNKTNPNEAIDVKTFILIRLTHFQEKRSHRIYLVYYQMLEKIFGSFLGNYEWAWSLTTPVSGF
jgi:hypothetical protein